MTRPPKITRNGIPVLCVLMAVLAAAAGGAGEEAEQWRVENDAETGAFDVEAWRLPPAPGRVRRYRLAYPSGDPDAPEPDNRVPAELYLPADAQQDAPVPAVVILHILNGNYEFERLIAGELARHGIAALWFKLPHYGERRNPGERLFTQDAPDRLFDVFDRGALDVRRAFDLLAAHPEIDGARIGIAGLSMGGMVAAYAASQEPRTERLALLISGGGLGRLIAETNEMRHMRTVLMRQPPDRREAFLREIDRLDPLRAAEALAELAQAGRVLMLNAEEDEVVPASSARALARALGIEDRVVWLPGVGHYTVAAELPLVMERLIAFWSGVPAPYSVAVADPPLGAFAEILGTLVLGRPETDTAYQASAFLKARPENGRLLEGRVSWKQGPDGRFRIDAETDEWGRISIGQAERPWIWIETVGIRVDGDVPLQVRELGFPDDWDLYRRVAGETLRWGSRIPGMAGEQLRVREEEREDRGVRMEIQSRHFPGVLYLDWSSLSDSIPHALEAQVEGTRVWAEEIRISTTENFAPEEFAPPPVPAVSVVGTRDLASILLSLLGVSMPAGR